MPTLSIIGAGGMGMAVATLAARAGWDLVLSNSRGPDTLGRQVGMLGPRARATTVAGAAEAADLVVLPIPFSAFRRIDPAPLVGQTILETTNYYPGYSDPEPRLDSQSVASSVMLQEHFEDARVVKVFNTIYRLHLLRLARVAGAADRSGIPIAGEPDSLDQVGRFLDQIGFDAVEVGPLSVSWRIEPGTPAFVTPYQVRPELHFTQDPGTPASAARIQADVLAARRA